MAPETNARTESPGAQGAVSTVLGENVRFATVLAALTFIGAYALMAKVALPRIAVILENY